VVGSAVLAFGCREVRDDLPFNVDTDGMSDATAGEDEAGGPDADDGTGRSVDDDSEEEDDGGDDDGVKLDVGPSGGLPGGGCDNPDGEDDCECVASPHAACDADTDDPFAAMGVGCDGGAVITTEAVGSASAIGVRTGLGSTNTWAPTEGERFAVIGSGFVDQLDSEPPSYSDPFDLEFELDFPSFCNDDLDGLENNIESGPLDPGTIPAPIVAMPVGDSDCTDDPTLVGLGDCSNTLDGQLGQGTSVNDYTALRMEMVVPADAESLSYDFAFFTTEYPAYLGSQYNDLFVGWVESEAWTGNVSFDTAGNPISLNAAFFDLTDAGGNAPELAGTCMRYHGATRWLTSTTAVNPGETIELVFAVFDLSDSILDSYAFVDNVRWGCDPSAQPGTFPAG